MYNPDSEPSFYSSTGLPFECQRCSGCCRHSPGYVFLSALDLADLLENIKLPLADFFTRYLRIVTISGFHRLSLKEKPNYDCIFWSDGKCGIYDFRPLQCKSFPFWSSVLYSRESWESAQSWCPGINKGRLHNPEEIEQWLSLRIDEQIIEVSPRDKDLPGETLLKKYLTNETGT
ncbi:MAG: YkgJ family cysteine cluster protein [Spirochaetales bacterium]|nr:YkgJ family cysteine cluster protein [Spirochaetales bacterium]